MNRRRDQLEFFILQATAGLLATILGGILLSKARLEGILYPRYLIALASVALPIGVVSLLYAAFKLRMWPFRAVGRIRAVYLAPIPFRNEYYARLQQALQLELANHPSVVWEFNKPREETIAHLYDQFEVLTKSMKRNVVLLCIPRDVERFLDRVIASATTCQGRIVLIDREVPEQLRNLPSIRSVSIDNFKIGILAAFAISQSLPDCVATVIRGPGGDERRRGFEAGCKALAIETIPGIEVVDENWYLNRAQLELLLQTAARLERPVGIFAGNDEMAIGCARLWQQPSGKLVIVGCDHLPEIEYEILDENNPIIATVDTGFLEQVTRIVSAIAHDRVPDRRAPRLYPGNLQDAFKRTVRTDEHLRELWQGIDPRS